MGTRVGNLNSIGDEQQDEVLGVDTETEEQPTVAASCGAVGEGSCHTEGVSVLLQARQQCSSNSVSAEYRLYR